MDSQNQSKGSDAPIGQEWSQISHTEAGAVKAQSRRLQTDILSNYRGDEKLESQAFSTVRPVLHKVEGGDRAHKPRVSDPMRRPSCFTSPLTDIFDFWELGEEPLLVLGPQALGQLRGRHEVVHGDAQAPDVRSLRRHQLKLRLIIKMK